MSITQENEVLKLARSIVQYYREYEKLLVSLFNSVNALANMTHQKETLESTIRRNRSFASDVQIEHYHNFDKTTSSSDSCKSTSWSSLCVTGSLGMLLAFPATITEHLVGQHQLDQTRLLQSMSELQQRATTKSRQLQTAITSLEENNINISLHNHEKNLIHNSSISKNNSCVNKTKQKTIERNGNSLSSTREPEQTHVMKFMENNQLIEVTGLENVQSLVHASYGIMRAMIEMNSLLQETILALRKDLFRRFVITSKNNNNNIANMKSFAALVKSTTNNNTSKNVTSSNNNNNSGMTNEQYQCTSEYHYGIYEKVSDNGGNSRKAHSLSELFALELAQEEPFLHKPLQINILYKRINNTDDIQDHRMSFHANRIHHVKKTYFLSDALDMLPDFLQIH